MTILIAAYLEDSTSRIAALKDAAARRDWPVMRFTTHSLKGSSSTIGASRLAAICGEMEERARNPTADGPTESTTAIEDEFARVRDELQIEQGRMTAGPVPAVGPT
jgi:HPt (histidine-containing phosphotransfer) domain-containing protein